MISELEDIKILSAIIKLLLLSSATTILIL